VVISALSTFLTGVTDVTLEQTDQLLADWRKKIDFVSQNLIDLTSFPTYQRLTGVSGFPKVKLKGITEGLESDPLGASEDFNGEIQPLIERVKATLEQLVQQQAQIRDNFEIAHAQLKKLLELHATAEAAFAESTEKVTDHSTLQTPLASDQLKRVTLS
jgi:hypothetical protein